MTLELHRHLAAVLTLDLVGYSSMVRSDEQRTLTRLLGRRTTVIDPTVDAFRGRVVKGTGDGILATFASAQDAVRCSIALHAELAAANDAEPALPKMIARIGVTLGDIFRETGGDIFGDGVNIAARLEACAPPGGTCVSARLLDDLHHLGVRFVDRGDIMFKNMAEPVRVYCIMPDAPDETPLPGKPPSRPRPARRARLIGGVGALAALAAAAGFIVLRQPRPTPDRTAMPSLVVMPLRDLSDRPGRAYLADAITDDLTTDLSHLPGATVIARETADSYKGRNIPVAEIGHQLGVRYLVAGSVRASGDRLHVNAQLIDARDSTQLWAQRFDTSVGDLDQARDAIVRRIADLLDEELTSAELVRGAREHPDSPDARDLFYRARSVLDHGDQLADFRTAQQYLERAITIQPGFVDAKADLAAMLLKKVRSVDDPDEKADFAEATRLTSRVLAAQPHDSTALAARAMILLIEGKPANAQYAARDALIAAPDNLAALNVIATCASAEGQLDEAAAAFEMLLRLNPGAAAARSRRLQLGNVRLLQGRPTAAIELLHHAVASDPEPRPGADNWGRAEGARMLLIGAYAESGDLNTARHLYRAYDRLWPNRTVWRIGATAPRPMAALPGFARFLGALRAAGMPEWADEHADLHVAAPSTFTKAEAFAPTPVAIPGGRLIDTAALASLAPQRPLIVDLGRGTAVPVGAVWQDPESRTHDDFAFVDAAVAASGCRPSDPVVLMADGTFGFTAYNAALHLTRRGYANVYWYRGGEEAWAAAREPAIDRRV